MIDVLVVIVCRIIYNKDFDLIIITCPIVNHMAHRSKLRCNNNYILGIPCSNTVAILTFQSVTHARILCKLLHPHWQNGCPQLHIEYTLEQ